MQFQTETINRKPELIETNITKLKILSIYELCVKYNCKETELPELLNRTAKSLFQFAKKHEGSYAPDLDENIETIFLLYHATRDLQDDHLLTNLSHQLDGLDPFLKSQGQEKNLKLRAELIKRIHTFMMYYAESESEITVTSFPRRGIGFPEKYFMEGEWLRVSSSKEKDIIDYAKPDVVAELVALLEQNKTIIADYTHSTLSPALDSIAKHHTITSGAQTISRGDIPTTGEDTFYVGKEGSPISGGEKGHKYIFADTGVQDSYGQHRWFDEFAVSFGMSKEKVFDNLEREGVEMKYHNQMMGDGYIIGAVFSLDNISHIYAKSANLESVKKWSEINAPNASVISLEAVALYYRYIKTDDMSKKIGIEDLKKIANSPEIKI